MFTVCPKCALTLVVTAADLRAGQGYVRCGRCANVFNALLGLSEESTPTTAQEGPPNPLATATSAAPAAATVPAGIPAPPIASQPPIAAVPPAAPPAAPPQPMAATPPAPPAQSAPPTPPALRLVESPPRPPTPATLNPETDEWDIEKYHGTGTFETIVLEGDTFLQTEELIPEEALDSEIADVSRRIAAAHDAADLAASTGGGVPTQLQAMPKAMTRPAAALAVSDELRSAMQQVNQQLQQADPMSAIARLRSAPRARPGWLPVTGAILLALLLVAQALNHWRNDLATRTAWYGPLSRWSALLGEPLQPNWDLSAYDVHQLGAAADGADNRSLRVRLSLANRSERPQGMPLLRLTLLDRYGKALSAGELTPAQYLPASLRGERLMAREQRVDTEVAVLDPTQQASSFELDVCVAIAGGGVRCAGDAATSASTP